MYKVISVFILFSLISSSFLYATKFSSKDYQWISAGLGESEFLKPRGWFVKIEYGKTNYALFISKEEIKNGSEFKTGLSLNYNSRIIQKTGSEPTEYAIRWISELATKMNKKIIKKPWRFKIEDIEGFAIQVNDKIKTMHYLLLANNSNNSLYIIFFESPPDEWQDAWKIGNVILNNIRLDTGF